jgi:hypothetical protein
MFIIKNKIRRKFIMKNKNMLIFVISALLCLPIFLFADTETEPNDAWDATGVLEVENGVHDGEINPGSDEDYWAFQASEGDFVEVSTVGLTTLDTKLWIYDTDGVTELEYNDDFGGLQSYVSHTMDEDGTYYFRVGSWSNNTGAYGVELSGANLPVHYDNDLQARWVTGDANPVEGVESIYEVMVKNPGILAQSGTNYTVKLFLEGDIEIGTAPGEDIDPGEQIGIDIPWTPAAPGETYVYGYVDFAADEYLDNNTTSDFPVNVQANYDLVGVSVTGNAIPTEGIESIYTITVFNQGSDVADTYTVELYLEGDIFIGSVAGTTINSGETIEYDIPWTPPASGVTYLYGYVDYALDEDNTNNTTPDFDVNVQSAGTIVVSVGDGTNTSYQIPANFFYRSSLSECWYYPEEIDFGGLITQVGYHTNWVTDLNDMPIRIWMGETTQPQALVGWIPAGDLTLVFDGTIDLPPGDNNILFPLDTFFGYSGANNLVVMVQRPMDTEYHSSSNVWYITNDVFHPAGTVLNDLPNIGFYFDSTPTGSL